MTTPKPWSIAIYHSPNGQSFDIFSPSGVQIANVHELDDARLISAAPDLLAALKALLGPNEKGKETFDPVGKAVRAVAKAEGR